MDWFPQGWNRFLFLVTPEEWESLLAGFHQVTFCCRVSGNYVESPPETLAAPWRNLYEKLQGVVPVDSKKDRKCFRWADGLTHDLGKCCYTAPFRDESSGEWFRCADFAEPCVGVQPFAMTIGEDGKLHTRFSYSMLSRLIAGLELQYPKKIAYFNESRDGYSRVIPCQEAETYREVYEPLTRRIKAMTGPLRFSAGSREYRSPMRVSPEARKSFSRFWFAREYKIAM